MKVCIAGATGWVGRELVTAIAASSDLVLAGAVSRSHAGRDIGEVLGGEAIGVTVAASVAEALAAGDIDVMVDYTKPAHVKDHALTAIARGVAVVIGTSGLTAADFQDIDTHARSHSVGVISAGNFSLTATLMQRFALMAAQMIGDVEVIDYAGAHKHDVPSGTARELAERLGEAREHAATAVPVAELHGEPATRGAVIGGVPVHSVRVPGFTLSCEAIFGLAGERLTIRHDAGTSAQPYVAGTLLAIRHVRKVIGLRRGLDSILARA